MNNVYDNNSVYYNIRSLDDIAGMDGHDFEYYCASVLKRIGFTNVEVTPGSGDFGADIIAEKDGISYAIQCKCFNGTVGNSAVQEAYSAKAHFGSMIAAVMTNSTFTSAAQSTAKTNKVLLWDCNWLEQQIKNTNPEWDASPSSATDVTHISTEASHKFSGNKGCLIFILIMLLAVGASLLSDSDLKDTEYSYNQHWETAEISDFDYKIIDGQLELKKYHGTAESVIVLNEYQIDGTQYKVNALNHTFQNSKIRNCIISDGISVIGKKVFSHCIYLQRLYIPKSALEEKSHLNYIDTLPVLYYGGSKEQLKKLIVYEGRLNKANKIYYNSSVKNCKKDINQTIKLSN